MDRLQKLFVGPGEVVVVTGPARASAWLTTMERLARALPDNLVVVLPPGVSIEALDEDVMRTYGWVRR